MRDMFHSCILLTEINFSKFNTSALNHMDGMFYDCISLTSLNLSHFSTKQVESINNMFCNCLNLEYINLYNFSDESLTKYNDMFSNIPKNAAICLKENNSNTKIIEQIKNKSFYIIDCSNNWKLNRKKLIIKNNSYIDNCYNDPEYKYEYDGKCYNNCSYYYYIDNNINYKCTNNNSCPNEYNKLIPNKSKCIKNCSEDDIYKFEYNNKCYLNSSEFICTEEKPFQLIDTVECFKYCDIIDIIKNFCILNYEGEIIQEQDLFLENIKIGFISSNVTLEIDEGKEIILKNNNMTMTLTSSDIQKNYINKNMTSIDLGDCENELRKYYNISNEQKLYIIKIDIEQNGYKITKVEYDIYSKINNSNLIKLNKLICSNTKANIYVPITLTDNLDIFNSSSGYYNDVCYITPSDSDTDITLKDRKEEFINDNKTVCQDDCVFEQYYYDIHKARCSCKVKESSSSTCDIIIDTKQLIKNFVNVINIANINIMNCYMELFNKKGILHNIGCFIIIPIIIFYIISIFIFYFKQKNELKNKIKEININIDNLSETIKQENERKKKVKKRKHKKKKPIKIIP